MNKLNFRRHYRAAAAMLACIPPSMTVAMEVDTSERWQVRDFFQTVYPAGTDSRMQWTGSYDSGNSGTVSAEWLEATRIRVNFYRAMAGLPAQVSFNPVLNAKCQDAALMISENANPPGQLYIFDPNTPLNPHIPPDSWIYDGETARDAAINGNLAWGSTGPEAVNGYMIDFGGGNSAVGHRRWVLLPQSAEMGSGDTPGNDLHYSTNTLWVIPDFFGPRPPTRTEYVAWPPAGHVPYPLVWSRWSFSYPGASFAGASVAMKKDGQSLPVALETVQNGYGENSIVFVPNGMPTNMRVEWPAPASDEDVEVTVSNVLIGGQQRNFTYTVTIFDPADAGGEEFRHEASLMGKSYTTAPTYFSVAARPWAEALQARVITSTEPVASSINASTGNNPLLAFTSAGYTPVQTQRKPATSTAAFHLVTPDGARQTLTLPDQYLLGQGANFSFQSSLAYATGDQFASVDMNLGDGDTWVSIWSQRGPVQAYSGFSAVNIDLSAYTGMTARFRFRYDREGGVFYPQTDPYVGWAFDNIILTSSNRVTGAYELPAGPANPARVSVTFEEPGSYLVQSRSIAFGGFGLEWGPVTEVNPVPITSVDAPTGQWTNDPVFGWMYAYSAEWKYSFIFGFIYTGQFPWVYTSSGWAIYIRGSVYNGLWLYHADRGFIYTQHDYGGWFQHSPFTMDAASWKRFY